MKKCFAAALAAALVLGMTVQEPVPAQASERRIPTAAEEAAEDPENLKCEEQSAREELSASVLSDETSDDKEVKAVGIDVYSGNGDIDWEAVAADGVDFAIIRVAWRGYGSSGNLFEDSNATANIEGALAAGLDVGVYCYSQAISEEEVLEEAELTLDVIEGYDLAYPVAFDYEGYENSNQRVYGTTKDERSEYAKVFLDYVESQGYEGMLYGSSSHFKNDDCWNTSELEQLYDIWVAQYWLYDGTNQYSTLEQARDKSTSYTGEYSIWQCSEEGTVSGIDSNVDLDIAYMEPIPEFTSGTPAVKPETPVLVSAEAGSNGITVSWDSVEDATGYNIYRKSADDEDSDVYALIGSVSGGDTLSYTDTAVQSGVSYIYTVSAVNRKTEGDYDEAGIQSPAVLIAEYADCYNDADGVTLDWIAADGAEGYIIARSEDGGDYEELTRVSEPGSDYEETEVCTDSEMGEYTTYCSYTDEAVKGGHTYCYAICPLSDTTDGIWSEGSQITFVPMAKHVSAEQLKYGVKLTWEASEGAEGYLVYRKTSDSTWKLLAKVAGDVTSYTDAKGVNKTTYQYKIRAYKGSSKAYCDKKMTCKYVLTLIKYVTKQDVNYRTGPGVSYTKVGRFKKGKTIYVVGGYKKTNTSDGYTWYRIYSGGKYYYIARNYIKKK